MLTEIRIQQQDFDVSQEYQRLRQLSADIGAIVFFSGLVRQFEKTTDEEPLQKPPLRHLSLQHYPGMTEKLLAEIVAEAGERWPLEAITVIHRVGKLKPADQIVFVGVAAAHRQAAYAASEFVMDYLKTRATLWKSVDDGSETTWIDSKQSDVDAAERWNTQRQDNQ